MEDQEAKESLHPDTPPQRLWDLAQKSPKLGALVAQNPSAPPDLLEKLFTRGDPPLLAALARNPNTPVTVLVRLGALYGEHFLQNPVLPLLELEQPDFFERAPYAFWKGLLSTHKLPEPLCRLAASHTNYEVRRLLALNRWTLPDILEALAGDEIPEVQRGVAQNPHTPPRHARRLRPQ